MLHRLPGRVLAVDAMRDPRRIGVHDRVNTGRVGHADHVFDLQQADQHAVPLSRATTGMSDTQA